MEEKKKNVFLIGMSILLVLVLVIGGSYAWFTLTIEGTKTNTLRVGNLALTLDDESSVGINQDNALPMLDEDGEKTYPYHFTLKNEGSMPSEYTIYLDDDILDEGEERIANSAVKYQLDKNGEKTKGLLSSIESDTTRILDSGKIKGNSTNTYDLRLWLDENVTSEASGQVFKGKIRIEAVQSAPKNKNIKAVYKYNDTTCLTGEESTCVMNTTDQYEASDIIRYQVNDTKEEYFYVLFDDENTITMQHRDQTANSTWGIVDENTNGPVAALSSLEQATSDWINVKDQTYTMGTTVFGTNHFTGCSETSCTVNTYTLPTHTSKARMITAQEAMMLGCGDTNQSCPTFMISGYHYWTMSANSASTSGAILINQFVGKLVATTTKVSNGGMPIRAVVVVNK